MTRKEYLISIFVVIIFVIAIVTSLLGGRYMLEPEKVIAILWEGITGQGLDNMEHAVIWKLRMPRIILNCLIGAALAISGTAFQGIFRNPLVSPDVLGVSSGAAFGAVLGILMSGIDIWATSLAVFFGVFSVFLTYSLSKLRGESTTLSLVLSGMIISSVFGALISLIKYTADPYEKLPAITYWLMGSFSSGSVTSIKLVGAPILIGMIILILMRWRINILSLSDEEIYSLGVNPVSSRRLVIAIATLITAAGVTVTGIIGWVGLVIPHICRMLMGVDHKKLMPLSCIVGATFMVIVDFIARTASAAEIPIGILTALVGAPFFAILFKQAKGDWR